QIGAADRRQGNSNERLADSRVWLLDFLDVEVVCSSKNRGSHFFHFLPPTPKHYRWRCSTAAPMWASFLPFIMGQAAYPTDDQFSARTLFKLDEEVGSSARSWRAFTHDDARISTSQGHAKEQRV